MRSFPDITRENFDAVLFDLDGVLTVTATLHAAAAADRSLKSPAERVTVTDTDVARRAYDLYLARGCENGHDVDDWVQAEQELRAGFTTT